MFFRILNRINVASRRHFYGHTVERRTRRWFAENAPAITPANEAFWRGFNRTQTAVAYPLLTAWIFVAERVRKARVLRNEARIVALSAGHNTIHLQLEERAFSRGNVAQYYHFMYDLVLPLSRLIERTPENVCYTLKRIDGVGPILMQVFADRVRYVDEPPPEAAHATLRCMSPRVVYLSPEDIENFAATVAAGVGATPASERNSVVMIQRLMPGTGQGHTGGLRRRIRNHDEVANAIAAAVRPEIRFVNASLEEMSLKEQVELFSGASLIIAQHGAALGNIIWAQPGTPVVEIYNNYYFDFFRRLGRKKQHPYHLWPVISGHPSIDPDEFLAWLRERTDLHRFFS